MPKTDTVYVLVVDDLAAQRLTTEAALAELGETVVSVGSGREALKFLLDHDAAVIVLDVNMPEMDGFETAALIRQRPRSAGTPIIFLTADTDELRAARGYALGAVDYLFCPFLPEVLRAKVRVFVELSRARQRIRREAEQRIALSREQAARAVAEAQGRRLRFIAEASGALMGAFDNDAFVGEVLERCVPAMGDVAALALRNVREPIQGTTWRRAPAREGGDSAAHTGPATLERALDACLATGAPITLPEGEDATTGIALPLAVHDESFGAFGILMTDSGRRFDDDDLQSLRLVAGRIAVALDNLRLYEELHDRDRRKDEFLAMLSHELRNPLGAISTAARVLERVGVVDERAARAQGVIVRQSRHLGRIVDDLLEVSAATAGRIALVRAPANLREVVERAAEGIRLSGRLDDHRLVVRCEEHLFVEADEARIEQVVANLLVNAAKYTDPGGEVTVELAAEGGEAVVRVRDNGIGIAPDLLPRVFDVFVQGRQTLDRAQGGMGLGLALVRKLVELHGGSVQAQSEGPGRGSTFVVRLPRISEQVAGANERPEDAPGHRTLRVLVVEDHEDTRDMLRMLLQLRGHEVHEADTGAAAVEQARHVRPHLALVDLGLPQGDGFEVARRLRNQDETRATMLVAVTGYGTPEDRGRTREAGFDAHLVKPVAPEQLAGVLEAAARRPREAVGSA